MNYEETKEEKAIRELSEKNNPYAKECPNRHLWSEGYRAAHTQAKNLHKPLVMPRIQNIAAYFSKKTPMPSKWSNDILDYILNRSEYEA